MKKPSKSKIKKIASKDQVTFLVKEALKLNLQVSLNLVDKKIQYLIKNDRYTLEQFEEEPSELEFLRVETFINEYGATQASEARAEELFNNLVGNLSPEHKTALNLF